MKTNEMTKPEIRRILLLGIPAFFALTALLSACSPSPAELQRQAANSARYDAAIATMIKPWADKCHTSSHIVVVVQDLTGTHSSGWRA